MNKTFLFFIIILFSCHIKAKIIKKKFSQSPATNNEDVVENLKKKTVMFMVQPEKE